MRPKGLQKECPHLISIYNAAEALVEVVADDEERDLWQIYLDRKDFANAFRRCRNQVCLGRRESTSAANNAQKVCIILNLRKSAM